MSFLDIDLLEVTIDRKKVKEKWLGLKEFQQD